jgi:hypothetical protein
MKKIIFSIYIFTLFLEANCAFFEKPERSVDSSLDISSANLNTDLVAYYPMDSKNLGMLDSSGNTKNGSANGYVGITTGHIGNSFYFSENSKAEADLTLDKNTGISISMWIKLPYPTGNAILTPVMKFSSFGILSQNETLFFNVSNPSTNSSSGDATPGVWTHFIGTYDGLNIKVYINGELKGTTYWPGVNTAVYLSPFSLGYTSTASPVYYWCGYLDEVRIYNRILSESEMRLLADQ